MPTINLGGSQKFSHLKWWALDPPMLRTKALHSVIIVLLLSLNCLITIIFANFNRKNNCHNCFVKP